MPPEELAAVWPGVDVLDEEAAYTWFTRFGYGAQLFIAPPPPSHEQLYTFYWNSLRMGGRNPADVGRAITLGDTLAALGLSESATDPAASSAIDAFEQANGLEVVCTCECRG